MTAELLETAQSYIGVMEVPPGSNRGPEVDRWIRLVGLDPEGHYPWCAAFVYGCFRETAERLGIANPCPKTGAALGLWMKAKPTQRITPNNVNVKPGMVFVLDLGHGTGHVGFVESVNMAMFNTIEGNTNTDGSREGIGVFRRQRAYTKTLRGFLDFTLA